MSPAPRPAGALAPPLTLHLDGSSQTIASVAEAARFIRDNFGHPQVIPACPLLNMLEAAATPEAMDQVWSAFATWALVAGLTRPRG